MAHAADYDHDIFISYAHDDNHAPGDAPGWVDQFHEWLESLLKKRRGLEHLSIWRDSQRMSGNTVFGDEIKDNLNGSALFFALISRNYLKSEYCLNELTWYHQRHGAIPTGLKVGNQYRIFAILLNNIPHEQYQQQLPLLKGITGFSFHDGKDQKLSEFIPIQDERFGKQLNHLVDGVQVTLEPMQETKLSAKPVQTQANTIYLADVSDPLQPFKTRLANEIKGQQGTVVPNVPPPWEFDPHADEIRRIMDEARYSIHLFDQWQGRIIDDRPETTYAWEQFSMAKESSALPLVWVPPELEIETIENQAQRQFLLDCKSGDRESGTFEFVQATQSDFIHLVRDKLALPIIETRPSSEKETFLVDTHKEDQAHAFDLASYLAKLGLDVAINKESYDPLTSLSIFENAIRQVQHLIIIFGEVAPAWLSARVKLALKAINEQLQGDQRCCLEKIWVYKMQAIHEDDIRSELPPFIKIDILDNSHRPSIDPKVAGQLLGASAGSGGGL